MKVYGRFPVSEFLEDMVVYRNLEPADRRLLPLESIRQEVGLPPGRIPRKSEPDYAKTIVHLLKQARALGAPEVKIERLIFIGDTRLNDGTAFDNLCRAGEWPGLAFIGSENNQPAAVETVSTPSGQSVFLANRWGALVEFEEFCGQQGFQIDEATAIIIDLDKTTLGARGRNAHVIDGARLQAVRDTVAGLLGDAYDSAAFKIVYDRLNQVEFHPFTTDNQDYLAYICLILGSGLYDPDSMIAGIRSGKLASFREFIDQVDGQAGSLPPALAGVHADIYVNVKAGDPTPFKSFRRNEYLATVGRMGQLDDASSVDELLASEILITQEVRALALDWKKRGALLFGLSDKPDEASIPTAELAARGYQPIHRTATHAVGME
jgi:hypothetical protein